MSFINFGTKVYRNIDGPGGGGRTHVSEEELEAGKRLAVLLLSKLHYIPHGLYDMKIAGGASAQLPEDAGSRETIKNAIVTIFGGGLQEAGYSLGGNVRGVRIIKTNIYDHDDLPFWKQMKQEGPLTLMLDREGIEAFLKAGVKDPVLEELGRQMEIDLETTSSQLEKLRRKPPGSRGSSGHRGS